MDSLSNIIERVKSYEPLWDGWRCTGKLLGSGGSGCVLALGKGEDHSVVKVISIDNSAEKYEMVNSEIKTMLAIRGHYLVECLDCRIEQIVNRKGELIGYDFLIHMHEYIPLSVFLKEEEFDPEIISKHIAYDIGLALGTLHSSGILHRDIKPENIFLDDTEEDMHFRLGDFGVSKKLNDLSGLTATGTPDFMAPESFRYYEYDYRTDIYSLGMTLYYILNDLHFPQFSMEQTQQDFWDNNRRRLSGEKMPLPKYGSEELQKVVLKCCEAEPKNRYQDISELLNELFDQHFVPFGMKQKRDKTELRKKASKSRQSKNIFFALSASIIIIVIVAVVYWVIGFTNQAADGGSVDSTITVETNTNSIYTSDFIENTVDSFSHKVEEMKKNTVYRSVGGIGVDARIMADDSLYLKIRDDVEGWAQFTHYTEYCFNSDGKLFYIYRVKAGGTYQYYVYADDIICMKVKGDLNNYYYGDPNITDNMKNMVLEAYNLYEQYHPNNIEESLFR